MLIIPTFDDYFPLLRSSGPVSYGYSELENNNPSSVTSAMVGDVSLQTPGLEYSAPSFKREIVVSGKFNLLKPPAVFENLWMVLNFSDKLVKCFMGLLEANLLPWIILREHQIYFWYQYFLQTPGEVGTVQSGGQVKVRRGQMVDKGQVTEDIEAEMSASHRPMSAPGSPSHSSEHCQAPGNDGTSIGHRVVLLHVTLTHT